MFKTLHNILYMSILYIKCVYLFSICCTAKKRKKHLMNSDRYCAPICVKSTRLLMFWVGGECVKLHSIYFFILKFCQRLWFCCCCQPNKGENSRHSHLSSCFCEICVFLYQQRPDIQFSLLTWSTHFYISFIWSLFKETMKRMEM